MNSFTKIFATVFGIGYCPLAPGTAGTLAGVVLFWLVRGLPLAHYVVFVMAFIAFASWIAGRAQGLFSDTDPSRVVIDEAAGFLVAMTAHAWSWKTIVVCFLLFRFFDVVKPFPIRRLERRITSGFGVVLDDVLAGIYANICLIMLTGVLSLRA